MLTPFDEKSPLAHTLDRLAFRIALLVVSLMLGYLLYLRPIPAFIGGSALYIVLLLSLFSVQRMHLRRKESALRQRLGGALALESLCLMEPAQAHAACVQILAQLSELSPEKNTADGALCRRDEKLLLIRCVLDAPGDATGCSAVLSALRARISAQADRVILCTTSHFDTRAISLAAQYDEEIRLIDAGLLRSVCGKMHPATDAQLAALSKRKRSPFSWPRLKIHIFSPGKEKRYLGYAFIMLILYLWTNRLYYLFPALLCFLLSLGAHRAARRPFRL